MSGAGKPIEILLVEDNPGDVRLIREALAASRIANRLHVVGDGVPAMAFLRLGQYAAAPRPGLILLDLNLPRKDGREVLAEIKGDPDLKRIPVVVLTTSQVRADIVKSYESQANSYIVKPGNLEDFVAAIEKMGRFWLSLAALPTH